MYDFGAYSSHTHFTTSKIHQEDPENTLYFSPNRVFLTNRDIVSILLGSDLVNKIVDDPDSKKAFF